MSITNSTQKATCPLCEREVSVEGGLWETHDGHVLLRAVCHTSRQSLEEYPPRMVVQSIYAFVSKDDSGDEGIVAAPMPNGGILPLLGADMDRIRSLWPYAQMAANMRGHEVKLAIFSVRTDVETLVPQEG